MKNILNNVIVAFVALALTFATVSCKKSEDPKPVQIHNPSDTTTNPNTNPTDSSDDVGSNTAPVFNSTSITVVSDGSAKVVDISSLILDADGNPVTIKSIEPMTNVSNVSGATFTVTPSNSVFAGAIEYIIIVTDETSDSEPTSVTVNYGTPAQIATYNILISNNFLNRMLQGTVGNMYINSNGSITSNQNSGFYNSALTSATYTITSSGYLEINAGGNLITYSVQVASGILVLTDIDTGEIFKEQ